MKNEEDRFDSVNLIVRDGATMQAPIRQLFGSRIGVIRIDPLLGKIAMPMWDAAMIAKARSEGVKTLYTPERLRYHVYPTCYEGLRGLTHITEKYTRDRVGEIFRNQKALEITFNLHAIAFNLRKTNIQEMRHALDSSVRNICMYLHPGVKDPAKLEGRGLVLDVARGVDSRARVNAPKSSAQVTALIERLNKREEACATISAIIALRRQVMAYVVSSLDYQVLAAHDFIVRLFRNWNQLYQDRSRRLIIIEELERRARLYEGIDIQPFTMTFWHVAGEFQEAALLMGRNQFVKAQRILDASNTSFALRIMRANLEQHMLSVSRKKHWPKDLFLAKPVVTGIETARKRLKELQTKSMRSLKSFNPEELDVYLELTQKYLAARDYGPAYESFRHALSLV